MGTEAEIKERTDKQLSSAFKVALQLRTEMRATGATEPECAAAIERILRANWPVPEWADWPEQFRLPRCSRCDGYGLVMRSTVNRLGIAVEEGTPCTCRHGDRYLPKVKSDADYTEAGKAPKNKPMTRWNG